MLDVLRTKALIPGLGLLALSVQCLSGDLYLNPDTPTALYHQGRLTQALAPGRVVEATPEPEDPAWLNVPLSGLLFRVRARDLRSEAQLREEAVVRSAGHEARVESLHREAPRRLDDALDNRLSAYSVMFDSAIRYRDSRTFYSRGAGGVTVIAPRPSMAKDTPKISRDRARRARRQFEHDADAYWDEYERLASERRSTAVELARTRALFREIERRFQRYRAGRADTSEEPYIVVSEAAPLFLHKRLRDEIREGTVVWGRPHPDDSEWLQIQVGAVVYEVRGSHLWSQYQADRELSSRLAELEWELVEQEETREMLEAWDGYLRDLIQSGRRAAGVDSRERGGRAGVFLSGSGYEILDYSVDRCPDYAYEVVNESDMERLVKDWTKERDDLEKRLTQVGKEIVSIRRDTVRTEQRLRQFADRFQRFQQNGLNRGF